MKKVLFFCSIDCSCDIMLQWKLYRHGDHADF